MYSLKRFIGGFIVIMAAANSWGQPAVLDTCVSCHGAQGVATNPAWPNLGGQHATYLALQLDAFRSGERKNPVMNGIAGTLSDSDIDALARWYAQQPLHTSANGAVELVAAGRNEAGYCHACHGMKGHPVADEWPVLAGQNADYLSSQLMGFKTGLRHHPLMVNPVKTLDQPKMDALGAYYSRVVR